METKLTGSRDESLSAIALTIYPMTGTTEDGSRTEYIHIDVVVEAAQGTNEPGAHDPEGNRAHRAMDRIIAALPYVMDDRWEKMVMPLLMLAGKDTQVAGDGQ